MADHKAPLKRKLKIVQPLPMKRFRVGLCYTFFFDYEVEAPSQETIMNIDLPLDTCPVMKIGNTVWRMVTSKESTGNERDFGEGPYVEIDDIEEMVAPEPDAVQMEMTL